MNMNELLSFSGNSTEGTILGASRDQTNNNSLIEKCWKHQVKASTLCCRLFCVKIRKIEPAYWLMIAKNTMIIKIEEYSELERDWKHQWQKKKPNWNNNFTKLNKRMKRNEKIYALNGIRWSKMSVWRQHHTETRSYSNYESCSFYGRRCILEADDSHYIYKHPFVYIYVSPDWRFAYTCFIFQCLRTVAIPNISFLVDAFLTFPFYHIWNSARISFVEIFFALALPARW